MRLGRPIQSDIRQNIVEILYFMKKGYGYEIHKIYKAIFAPCTREVVYYHLRKGAAIGEFKVEEVKKEEGKFSWGSTAEKIYYSLGPNAKPSMNARVRRYFDRKKRLQQDL